MNQSVSNTGRGRRLVGASAVGAVVVLVSLAGASGAFAANDDYLEISLDGVTYSSAVDRPIFNESLVYVPGAASSASIWVRNNGPDPAWLSSAAVMVRSDRQLDSYLGLAAESARGLSTRTTLGAQGTCSDIDQIWNLEPGDVFELGLVADLSLDAPNDTMNRTADFDVLFLLESRAASPRSACDALLDSGQPEGVPAAVPGNPGSSGSVGSSAELITLPGTGIPPNPGSNGISTAAMPGSAPAERAQGPAPMEQQAPSGIVPAGIRGTVEPIIRSVSGTLLIAVSVLFAAAVVVRVREGRYE